MIKSMTGFASRKANISGLGQVYLEIRSVNHKFLDIVCHLPEGFLYLEEKIKKEIEKKLKRGRVVCVLNIKHRPQEKVLLNKPILKEYYRLLNAARKDLKIKDAIPLDALISLPGVLNTLEAKNHTNRIWPKIRLVIRGGLCDILKARSKEGEAIYRDLRLRSERLRKLLGSVNIRFKKVIKEKASRIQIPEEKASFLKGADITEELVRVRFHIINFKKRLKKTQPVGKELDFIAQELSRETNTMGAKSIDAFISSNVVRMKSEIEKIREQLQNVE